MARLSNKRRRDLKVRQALTLMAQTRDPSMVAKEGVIRSSHKPVLLQTQTFHAPRPLNFDGQGKRGRIVDGKVKLIRQKRFH